MIQLSVLVDEEYIEEFVQNLPIEKVRIVEHNFQENKKLFEELFNEYKSGTHSFYPYSKSIQNMNSWLENRLQE